MAYPRYSEDEKKEFIAVAQEIGISPAKRKLGYPASYNTGLKFFEEAGIPRPDIDSLMQKAAEMKVFYGDSEKHYAIDALIDRIVEQLKEDDLDADQINKLANALSKAIQTKQLVEGKSTSITTSKQDDDIDGRIADEISKIKAQNALRFGVTEPN